MTPHPNVINNTGRGSLMYIRDKLIHREIKINSDCDKFEEAIIVEINLNKNDKLVCASIYRREKSSEENNQRLLEIFKKLSDLKCSHLAIMGDFNLRHIN